MERLAFVSLLLLTGCVAAPFTVSEDPAGDGWPDSGPSDDPGDDPGDDDGDGDDDAAADDDDDDTSDDPPDPLDAAVIVGADFPAALTCGEGASASVAALNTGTTVWTRGEGYKLGGVGGEDPFAHHRVRLPEGVEVLPGEEWVFTIELEAPAHEGSYVTDWGMVRESVHWFGETVAEVVEVTCPPEVYPPPIAADFGNVVWIHEDVSGWPETVTMTASKGVHDTIDIPNDGTSCGPGDRCWPNFNPTYVEPGGDYYDEFVGGVWIFVYQDDVWVAGLFDSILRDQQLVWDHNLVPGSGWPGGLLDNFQPVSGERYGWMISTAVPVLSTQYTIDERSNVSEFVWP